MLYTPAFKPQVTVSVNDLPAVCPEQNCDYLYIDGGDGTITDVQYNESTQAITITGSGLSDRDCVATPEPILVEFGGAICDYASSGEFNTDSITCALVHAPLAGDHQIHVSDSCGRFKD